MLGWLKEGQGLAAVIGAVTTCLGVIFGYKIKSKNVDNLISNDFWKNFHENWDTLLEENTRFRIEIKEDLELAKKEKVKLAGQLDILKIKLEEVIKENLELRKREISLNYRLQVLTDKNKELIEHVEELKKFKCERMEFCKNSENDSAKSISGANKKEML